MGKRRAAVDREMLDADFIVCMPASAETEFTDNVTAICCQCGRSVQHRPYVPRKVRKLCTECALGMVKKIEGFTITQRVRAEVAAVLKRRQH
jgi:hypothetical protein